jgi:hypothetical protein
MKHQRPKCKILHRQAKHLVLSCLIISSERRRIADVYTMFPKFQECIAYACNVSHVEGNIWQYYNHVALSISVPQAVSIKILHLQIPCLCLDAFSYEIQSVQVHTFVKRKNVFESKILYTKWKFYRNWLMDTYKIDSLFDFFKCGKIFDKSPIRRIKSNF